MSVKLSDVFKQKNSKNDELWQAIINDRFIVVIWVSSHSFCKPKMNGLSLDTYVEVEMNLFYYINGDIWGKQISNNKLKDMGLDFLGPRMSHYHYLPIDMLFMAMNQLDSLGSEKPTVEVKVSAKVPEAKCKHCGRMNDIGIAECWNCLVRNPTER